MSSFWYGWFFCIISFAICFFINYYVQNEIVELILNLCINFCFYFGGLKFSNFIKNKKEIKND